MKVNLGTDLKCMLYFNEGFELISYENIGFYDAIMHLVFFRKANCFSA